MARVEERIRVVVKKYELINSIYEKMYETYENQRKALERDKIKRANELIGERGKLIEEIDRLNKDVEEIKGRIKAELGIEEFNFSSIEGKITAEHFNLLKEVTSKTKVLLERLIKVDEEVSGTYKQKFDAVREKLRNLKDNKKAIKAYKVNTNYARFMDKRK